MFGMNMKVCHNGRTVFLRPFSKDDMPTLVAHFSSMRIHFYTKGLFAQTLENETEWYDKNRKDEDSCLWAIQPEGSNAVVGVTGLHGIRSRWNFCSSGIIIWDPDWWHKGVASAAHLGRTMFAADYLNRYIINSTVRSENAPSRRALERVGYTIWGAEPVVVQREGRWLDTDHLKWFHPDRIDIYYPHGVPELFIPGLERAKIALETARKEVTFL